MGSFANSLFKILLGWFQGAVSAVWFAFTSKNGNSFIEWIGNHWVLIAAVLCVIGLITDLFVYIFRWKPFKVWQSFFSRHRENTDEDMYSNTDQIQYDENDKPGQREEYVYRQPAGQNRRNHREVDLTRWEAEKEQYEDNTNSAPRLPDTVTNAGYVVPADSPYRRPSDRSGTTAEINGTEEDIIGYEETTDREEPLSLAPKRRRRLKVTELFTDPEEELKQFDAPQHVIDSRKAYRDPVYPRGWKKSEDEEE